MWLKFSELTDWGEVHQIWAGPKSIIGIPNKCFEGRSFRHRGGVGEMSRVQLGDLEERKDSSKMPATVVGRPKNYKHADNTSKLS